MLVRQVKIRADADVEGCQSLDPKLMLSALEPSFVPPSIGNVEDDEVLEVIRPLCMHAAKSSSAPNDTVQ